MLSYKVIRRDGNHVDITAAVLYEAGGDFVVERVNLDDPRDQEIVVEIAGTGVCHSDLSFGEGSMPFPMPAVLGHEGAGIVVAKGAGVLDLEVGDHVVLSGASCGRCRACLSGLPMQCRNYAQLNMQGSRADGSETIRGQRGIVHGNYVGQSSFASHALTEARFAVKVPKDLPLAILGTLGCGVLTGAGAVLNSLHPAPGSSIAVFGLGAVGLSAIAAAKASGCSTIIGIDVNPARFEMARTFGATDVHHANSDDLPGTIAQLADGGLDAAVEASGAPGALRAAIESTHVSGTTILLGVAPLGTEYAIDSMLMLVGRCLKGCAMGGSNPQVFIPDLIDMYRQGKLPIDSLIKTYELTDIQSAFDAARSGDVVKPVLIP